MNINQFKDRGHYEDTIFIGKNLHTVIMDFSTDKKEIEFIVTDGVKIIKYKPYFFFDYLIYYHVFASKIAKDEIQKMEVLAACKSAVIQFSESMKRDVEDNGLCRKYDLGGFINQCNVLIEMAKIDLETKLLSSQMTTNHSVVNTNENIKLTNTNIQQTNENITTTNRNLIIIFLGTALISLFSLGLGIVNSINDVRIEKLNKRLELKDSLIQSQSKVIQQLSNKVGRY